MSSCLWFDSQAEEAANFYTEIFGGDVGTIAHYAKDKENPSGRPPGSVVTVDFKAANAKILALNGGPQFKFTPSFSFYVACESKEEVERYWSALSPGGTVRMALDHYPWSERYGWTTDRYGVEWQLNLVQKAQKISPAFLFVDKLFGRGQEAIDFYTRVFPNSKIEMMAKDPSNGNVMHCAFTLNDQPFVLMEGQGQHGHHFNEAFSTCINCENQTEIDHYWEKLVEGGGEHGPCGWLKDRFGVSWQVNPSIMNEFAKDQKKYDKAMAAMMKQKKIIIEDLVTAASQA